MGNEAYGDIRLMSPEEHWKHFEKSWVALKSYTYLGKPTPFLDTGAEKEEMPLRHDMRNSTGGITAAPLCILSPEAYWRDDECVPAPVTMHYDILDPARDVKRLEVIRDVISVGRTMGYSRARIVDQDNPSRVIAMSTGSSASLGDVPPGLYAVEKMGRRNLLLVGAVGMCVCQYIVAITGTVAGTDELPAQRAAIAFVCIYIFFFASSWGPVAWVVTGELFPLKVRAKCLSMTTASNWLLNWAIAYSTPYMTDPQHANLRSKVFFVWGSFCLVCIAFVYLMIYETKGLTLEQVDELYGIVSKAWKSKQFRPAVNFTDVDEGMRRMSLKEIMVEKERRASFVEGGDGAVAGEKV